MRPLVCFQSVTKRFGEVMAVDRVSLTIQQGEFFALLGPSGCGKTTLMRMLAGFDQPDSGDILLDGVSLKGVPPHRRPTNMMFQSYALFPHMRVFDNVAFGLKQEGLPKAEIIRRVEEVLALVKLETLARRKPDQLSGGQQQRVALARALVKRPKVLLLDEPLGALDRKLREATQYELKMLHAELGLTFLIVTHDQGEAMSLADRIAVMDHGRIVQTAPPREIYETPASRYVAEFVGDVNILEGSIAALEEGYIKVETPMAGVLLLSGSEIQTAAGDAACIALRPEKIDIGHEEPLQPANKAWGIVRAISYAGDVSLIQVGIEGTGVLIMKVSVANRSRQVARPIATGDRVWLNWDAEACVLLRG